MDLHNALEGMDGGQDSSGEASSPLQALKRLNETVTEALLAYLRDQPELASQHLSSALPQFFVAMTTLGLDPSGSHTTPLRLEQVAEAQRLIHIIGNRVEVRVDDEIRGSWSIWSVADLREVCRLAEEFDCGLVYSFIGGLSPSQPEFTAFSPTHLTPNPSALS